MVKQQRAARTREALVQVAASEFDRAGYEATTLARICTSAGLSIGALTFHFRSKDDLADAVQARGALAARAAAQRVAALGEPPLRSVIALTIEIARLLEADATVRASARLARERTSGPAAAPDGATAWSSLWLPALEGLSAHVTEGELRPGTDLEAVLALVSYLVTGAEAYARSRATVPGAGGDSTEEQLTRIWEVILPGISGGGERGSP